jgi:hypothetical protein
MVIMTISTGIVVAGDRMVVGCILPIQSVPITTDAVGSTPAQGEVYNIMWKSLSVTYGRNQRILAETYSSSNMM